MQITEYKDKDKKKALYKARFWYYKNGIRESKCKSGFTTKRDARVWCNTEKPKLESLKAGYKIKLKDYLDKWMEIKKSKLSPTTISGYKVNIEHLKLPLGELLISELTHMEIQAAIDEFSKTMKHRTVSYIYRTLHAALQYAVKAELLIKNPSDGIEINEDAEKFEASIYAADDLKKLLELLKEQEHKLYIPVLLASMRALRRGECLGLSWNDIDFDNKVARVRNNYVRVNGIDYHKKVKTKESERIIDMDGFVAEELKEYKNKSTSLSKYVCAIDGRLPDPTHISKSLNAFQNANNLPLCRFHDLRHSFAVLQLECGTDLDTLKRLMGHSKIGITSDIYLHHNSTLISKASRKMDNIVGFECAESVTKSENEESEASGI
jgi:integrase